MTFLTHAEVTARLHMPYVVSVDRWMGTDDLAQFVDMAAAIEFAKGLEGERVSFRNDDRSGGEGPCWDGEDVVSRFDDGLTEEEEDMLYDAGLR